jgi:iron complex outermembrane recepter protein
MKSIDRHKVSRIVGALTAAGFILSPCGAFAQVAPVAEAVPVEKVAQAAPVAQVAQAAPVAKAAAAAPTATDRVEEIVVTATRRPESSQSVPISVTALKASALQEARVDGTEDLAQQTPGLNMSQRSVSWVPTIRGIGTLDVSAGQETAVATYIDGVYISNVFGANVSFNNIERVEVLKGPQGTLFGRNATGGAIQIITREPDQEPMFKAKFGYGNFQTATGDLYGSGGLTDTLAADIAIHTNSQGKGYGRNVFTDGEIQPEKNVGFRSKWVWTPDDATKATFIADYSKQEGAHGDVRNFLPGSVGLDGSTALPGFYDTQAGWPITSEVKQSGASARIEHEFADFNFLSITAYRKLDNVRFFDNDAAPIPLVGVDWTQKVTTFTQELQLSSKASGKFKWITGAFFMNDTNGYVAPHGIGLFGLAFADVTGTGLPTGGVGFIDGTKTTSGSVFAEGTYNVDPQTRLTAGARYTQDKKEQTGRTEVYLPDGSLLVAIPLTPAEVTYRKPTFRLVVDHDIGDRSMVYASYNRGYRSGSYNSVAPTGIPVKPETVDAFELGSKARYFGGKLQLDGSLFYSKYQDLQVAVSKGSSQEVINAAEAEIKGADFEAQVVASEHLNLRFGAAFLKTQYKKFLDSPCTVRAANGMTVGVTCNPTGNDMLRSPPVTFNIGGKYMIPTSSGHYGASLNYFWTDKFNWEPDGRLQQKAYGLLNGQIMWSTNDQGYTVRLYGKNIANTKYASYAVAQPAIGDQYSAGLPRTYGVELEIRF